MYLAIFFFPILLILSTAYAQYPSGFFIGMPTLNLSTNAQTTGFGAIGVVALPTSYSGSAVQNPALLGRKQRIGGVFIGGSPIFKDLGLTNTYLAEIGNYHSFKNQRHVISTHLQYLRFDPLRLDRYDRRFLPWGGIDFTASFAYGYALSERVSIGTGIRYFYATESVPTSRKVTAKGISGDIGIYYQTSHELGLGGESRVSWGVSATNLGPKIFFGQKGAPGLVPNSLPTTLRLGGMIGQHFLSSHKVSFRIDLAYQLDKLLVPLNDQFLEQGAFAGLFSSFGDSPLGLRGELEELTHKFGLHSAVLFKKYRLHMRTGVHLEPFILGNRKYQTIGLGISGWGLQLDLSHSILLSKYHISLFDPTNVTLTYNYQLEK